MYNTTPVIDPNGNVVCRYRKIYYSERPRSPYLDSLGALEMPKPTQRP